MDPFNEIRIRIFCYVDTPLSLMLSNSLWKVISQDPQIRAEWLITKYGRAHALFHSIRLGSNFLTLDVIKCLISKKAILSRYFMQRLLLQYGQHDQRLMELKISYNNNISQVVNIEKLRACQQMLNRNWASDLSSSVFNYLMEHSFKIYGINLMLKGNDMELLHFLSAGPLIITSATEKLQKNINEIKDLILNKKFIPFPPATMINDHKSIYYEYPRKDGYENARQLNIIARAIVIYPELVNWWKQIGYHEICQDVNNLVMTGVFLILFPSILPTFPTPSEYPDEFAIFQRVKIFTDFGFVLHNHTVRDVVYSLSDKLAVIGDVLFKSFKLIRNEE
ncbi:hypothetical protein C1645_808657 [Glomus cerebriforme]|uniref:Uncharacterized protein n=1 Tax=Glomus cerebriforme TaxID=658196 RepID=A0A397SPC5_9GLOM|nr:hypothetical protein C1645_808657 [Glomus cerebriforme]